MRLKNVVINLRMNLPPLTVYQRRQALHDA